MEEEICKEDGGGFAGRSGRAQGHTHSRKGRSYNSTEVAAAAVVRQPYEFHMAAQVGHTADAGGRTAAQGAIPICWV